MESPANHNPRVNKKASANETIANVVVEKPKSAKRGMIGRRRGPIRVRIRTLVRPYLSPFILVTSRCRENFSWSLVGSIAPSRGYKSLIVRTFLYPLRNRRFSQKKTPREKIPLVSSGLCSFLSQSIHNNFDGHSGSKEIAIGAFCRQS